MTEPNWYIVYTKPSYELKVANLLTRKQIKNYCPLHIEENQFIDSKKVILAPLFTSCVFVLIFESEINLVLNTPGVINYLYWLNKPAVVPAEEMEPMILFLKGHANTKLEKSLINYRSDHTINNCQYPVAKCDHGGGQLEMPSLGYCIIAKSSRESYAAENNR